MLPDVIDQTALDGTVSFPNFSTSCWLSRGWTLQELIAPRSVKFYTLDWIYIGTRDAKSEELSSITKIDEDMLVGNMPVRAASVANIMSWASGRTTTRKEDIAYCLLGLFGIHMPLLYGEGDHAFIRLQEEIPKQTSDQSIFAWDPPLGTVPHQASYSDDLLCGIFAPSPACFKLTGDVRKSPEYWDTQSTLTNRGVRLRMPMKYDASSKTFIAVLCCISDSNRLDVGIEFHSISNSLENLGHLIRRSTPVRYGLWFSDIEVQFQTVYLATETSLWHTRYFGKHFLRPELEYHVMVTDPHNLMSPSKTWEICPLEVLDMSYPVGSTEFANGKRIAVLNPLKTSYNSAAILLPTKLSYNVALVFGFKTLPSGQPDIYNPWKHIIPMSKRISLTDTWSQVTKQPPTQEGVLVLTIDHVYIRIEFGQRSWWGGNSRNIIVSLGTKSESPMPNL